MLSDTDNNASYAVEPLARRLRAQVEAHRDRAVVPRAMLARVDRVRAARAELLAQQLRPDGDGLVGDAERDAQEHHAHVRPAIGARLDRARRARDEREREHGARESVPSHVDV